MVENKKEDVNILILGETGVGKSTWINGIANYAKHNTLKAAMDDPELTVLVPSRFVLTDEKGEEKEIKIGSDENEVLVSGQSATQFPREYVIETDTTMFHLIDTPGIGDCRGIEQDKENFDNILAFLTSYDKINAVVVFLKPNNARLTVAFRFCVLELLTHLHKSVVSNIIFAFSNTRGTLYRPGDSLTVLKELLEENKIGINLSPERYFCFDNEAFRILAGSKSGITFTTEDVELYSTSWVKSWETTGKLFQFVTTMKPHETKKTLSLNEARHCIIAISKPMGQAVELIEKNVKSAHDAKDQCKMDDADIENFKKSLKFKGFDLEIKQLQYPKTVCAAEECKTYVAVGESKQRSPVYPQICHADCCLKGIPVETTNNEQLRRCTVMAGGSCIKCNHYYKSHMHMTYTAEVVEKEFLSEEVQKKIKKKADLKCQKEAFIVELETHIKELEEEKETIYDSASFFGVFLKENAMIPYNDSFSEYFDMLIRDEEAKDEVIRDDKKIEQLKSEKQAYQEKKNVVTKSIESGSKDKNEVIPLEKVEEMRKQLCSLKHNGKTLSEALGVAISARRTMYKSESNTMTVYYNMPRRDRVSSQGDLQAKEMVENKKEDVNILVLGETGVGKSTWINGISNYAKHNSLQEAMDDPELNFLIPSRFVLTDEKGEEKEIKVGSDENEVLVSGQSATQFPREYVIETDTSVFHLIDTPGIGDSRGIEKDKENFDNILAYITGYDKINAVVVLLKPNNARLTVAFKFCVLELLNHLHKSVASNIIFAFTNTRGTLYRPGDSLPVLKELLQKNKVEIDLSPKSYFCFDNEAFRILASSKNGIKFTPEEVDLYSKSWVNSWEATGKLFKFVTSIPPHETKKTLSLNEARSCIIALGKPMGQAVELIEKNVKKTKDAKEECMLDGADINKFKNSLKFKRFDLEVKQLDYPITVCAAEECKKYVAVGGSKERNTVYPQICHTHCYLKGIPVETTNNEQLRSCRSMSDGNCTKCKHAYRSHMHMTYTADVVEKEFLSEEVQKKIDRKADLKSKKEAFIAELETRIKELEEEKEIIYECASYFGVFLKENAMIGYNDSFSEYLDMLIREEEAKEEVIRDDKKIEQLKNDKRAYEEKKNVIMKNITSSSKDKREVISIEDVETKRQKLCSLKHSGETLNKALGLAISARRTMCKSKSNTTPQGVKELVENKKEDVNILILGETGVGKSTWINGIANYAKHSTLQDAMDDPEFTVLIPSRFIFTNEEGDGIEIKVGSDENEVLVSGQSATQFPREYVIETSTTKFHLIDTPGIGDSRGIQQDKENFENILAFLTCYAKINAVVVLFKPNNARLTVAFRFCVLELLTHLHKSVVSNIIFAFTNSRGTFYRPGDSLPVLKQLLQEKNIQINLSPKSYFCFDNEAFRFLACSKSGIEFEPEEVDLYSKSWVKSCETTGKLFQFVTTMEPHDTKKTLSLNEARSCIIALSKPMGQAVDLIEKNVKSTNDAKDQCEMDDADIKKFMENLKFKGFELVINKLPYPMTVCAAEECKRYVPVGKSAENNTVYEQICHAHCYLSGVPVETTNNEQLRGCGAMSNGYCTNAKCKHDYRLHMHMTYTADVVEKEFLSEEVQKKIQKKTDLKSQKEAFIAELETRIKELEEEKETIYDSASFFGVFLKENALIPYNDSFGEYLDMLIREEEAKEDPIRDDKRIEQLKNEKKAYQEKKNVIMKNIESGSKDKNEVIPLEKVEEMRKKLCSLRHNGKTLNEALDVVISVRKTMHQGHKVRRTHVVIAETSTFRKVTAAAGAAVSRAWDNAKSYMPTWGSKSSKKGTSDRLKRDDGGKYSKRL